jgi:hypothetical protein
MICSTTSGAAFGGDIEFSTGSALPLTRTVLPGSAQRIGDLRDVARVADDAVFDLKAGRCGADINELPDLAHELLETQRAVVEGAGKAEAVLHEHGFARFVALIHAADLRDGGVAFIDEHERRLLEEIQQRAGRGTGFAAGEMAAVVLDALAEAHLLHHLDVILRAHLDALRFEQFAFLLEPRHALLGLLADFHDGFAQLVAGRDELLGGKIV